MLAFLHDPEFIGGQAGLLNGRLQIIYRLFLLDIHFITSLNPLALTYPGFSKVFPLNWSGSGPVYFGTEIRNDTKSEIMIIDSK